MVNVCPPISIKVCNHKDRRLGFGRPLNDADGISVTVGCAFIDMKIGQPFHKNTGASFFLERGRGDLANQHDVGNNHLFDGFNRIDKCRELIQMAVHVDSIEMRPLQNAPFCPIPASDSNFNPQNTQCIPAVKIFAFLGLGQN